MKRLFMLGVLVALFAFPQKSPLDRVASPTPVESKKEDSQHLVKHCLRDSAGIWKTEEVVSYCLSLVENYD